MGVIDGAEGLLDVEQPALVLAEVDAVVALEVDLHEDQPLVVLALDRLEEAPLAEDLLEDQVVGGGQVVKVVLRCGPLLRARDLVAHGRRFSSQRRRIRRFVSRKSYGDAVDGLRDAAAFVFPGFVLMLG